MDRKSTSGKQSRGGIPTLQDVADRVGVSPSTVSATLNDVPRARHYSEATKARIRAVAKEIGYFPNPLAKTLKRTRSGLIGVVMFSQHSAYYGRVLQAVEARCREMGYEVVTADMKYDRARLEECVHRLAAWRVEGLLLMTGGRLIDTAVTAALKEQGTPYVMAGVWRPDEPSSGIVFNDAEGGRLLAVHLTDLGHTRIGVLAANPSNEASEERLSGIRSVLKECGLELEDRCVIRAPGPDVGLLAGYRFAGELLDSDPAVSAIICMNDGMAIGAVRQAWERGKNTPRDISIAGFDDTPLYGPANDENRLGSYTVPSLTTIRTPMEEMGRAAARMLIEMIEDEDASRTKRVYEFMPALVVRDSTGPPRE